ncbi:MAG TPA: hypothetical protein VE779_00415 [Candidatus Angelobacter sp.]|nr:hypothetical protein [Candidatus Angelobacter sp.]
MRLISTFISALVAVLFLASALAQNTPTGTFDRQVIVLAYYRSPQWAATLKQKRAELADAKRANDQAKIQSLNEWGGQAQEFAHQQLWGDAPITNVMNALQPAFQEIEKSANVASIVPCPCKDIKTPTLDVTPQILDWLQADADTRKLIQEVQGK